jgi:hypothetical protein
MDDEFGKICKGNWYNVVEVLSGNLLTGNEQNSKTPQSGQPVSQPSF